MAADEDQNPVISLLINSTISAQSQFSVGTKIACILTVYTVFLSPFRALSVLGGHAWTGSPVHLCCAVVCSLPILFR